MTRGQQPPAPGPGLHVATIAHRRRIWDAYLEFDDDLHRPDLYRARIRFDAADSTDHVGEPVKTAVIVIEQSYEEAVAKARSFDDRQLQALLRSALPDDNA